MRALWKNTLLADSNDTVVVEGNHYFPLTSLVQEHFRSSEHHSQCHWKGTASYYDVVVGDAVNANAAWYYAEPLPAAAQIKGRVAFWRGVEIKS